MEYLAAVRELVDSRGLGLHLDGARVFNASVHHQVDVKEISQYFDSISVCLSKGLCAPVGSVLCGSAELITAARRWRKVLGGGMRQAGYIAAAGIVALNENVSRLQDDHNNAKLLHRGLAAIEGLNVDAECLATNMVFLPCGDAVARQLATGLREHDIVISPAAKTRLVVHKDVSTDDIEKVVMMVKKVI